MYRLILFWLFVLPVIPEEQGLSDEENRKEICTEPPDAVNRTWITKDHLILQWKKCTEITLHVNVKKCCHENKTICNFWLNPENPRETKNVSLFDYLLEKSSRNLSTFCLEPLALSILREPSLWVNTIINNTNELYLYENKNNETECSENINFKKQTFVMKCLGNFNSSNCTTFRKIPYLNSTTTYQCFFLFTQNYTNQSIHYESIPEINLSYYLYVSLIASVILMFLLILIVWYLFKKLCSTAETNSLDTSNLRLINDGNLGGDNETKIRKLKPLFLKPINIKKDKFEDYVKTLLLTNKLEEQHEALIRDSLNEGRVMDKNLHIQFIDLFYAKGADVKKAYSIIRNPGHKEIDIFWKLIWLFNIKQIVFFENSYTSNQETFRKYWPDLDKKIQKGDITIKCVLNKTCNNYILRKFYLMCRNTIKQVDQLHFLLPSDNLYFCSQLYVPFFKELLKLPIGSNLFPVLFHSSSNMRGLGFLLLCEISLRNVSKTGILMNISSTLKKLAEFSVELLIYYEHYMLVHKVILDVLYHFDTTLKTWNATNLLLFNSADVERQLKYLRKSLWLDSIPISYNDRNVYYEAFTENGRITFQPYDTIDENFFFSEKFHLITVDCCNTPSKCLVTQQPKADTFDEFVLLIQEKEVSLVVLLTGDAAMWPNKFITLAKALPDLVLQHKNTRKFQRFDLITMELYTKNTHRTLEVVIATIWPSNVLPKVTDFVKFVLECGQICRSLDKVLVACQDGYTACGLFITMLDIIQKIREEQICDVCASIRRMRYYCNLFVKNDIEFVFLLRSTYNYIKESNLYKVYNNRK